MTSPELHEATGAGLRRTEERDSRRETYLAVVRGFQSDGGEQKGEHLGNVAKHLVAQYVGFDPMYLIYLSSGF